MTEEDEALTAALGAAAAPRTVTFAECDRSRPPITITALGSTLTLVGPAGAQMESRPDQIGNTWPSTRTTDRGRTSFTYNLSAQQPEIYVRSGRLLFTAPSRFGTDSTECIMKISDPRWERIDATRFFVPNNNRVTLTKDLGTFPQGKGVLLAAEPGYGRGMLAVAGTPAPTRKTSVGRESVWVFEGLARGSYAVDVDMAFPDYGQTLVHIVFRVD